MNFDPRLIDGPNTLPGMLVVAQELLDRGVALDDIDVQMDDAAIRLGEDPGGAQPVTPENVAMLVGVDPPTPELIAEAAAAIKGATMAHSLGPGFQAFAEANNLKPLSDEFYVQSDQVSFCMTDGGLMVYTKDDNQVRLLPPKA